MSAADTPMFQQYRELKARQPDAILFFRMGDFYEMFFEDAELAARELELTLTSRNKNDEQPIPMAGVPHHAAAGYVQRLVEAGHRVAIAEQVEDPSLAKGLVRRDIVRVVTPGVAFDPTALDARQSNWLLGLCWDQGATGGYGLAFLDVSTGDLRVTTVQAEEAVVAEVHRFEPREALIEPGVDLPALDAALRRHRTVRSRLEEEAWQRDEALREVRRTLGVHDASGFGVLDTDPAVRAAGALLRYGRDTSGGELRNVHRLRPYRSVGFMVLDDTTRRNLELFRTLLGGQRKGSLVWLLDHCATAMGSRMLREWLSFPLLDVAQVERRLAAVDALVDEAGVREDLRSALREVADVERIGARVTQGSATPRDLMVLRRSLQAVPRALAPLRSLVPLHALLPADLCEDVREDLERWLVDDPPQSLDEGGAIRREADAELDELTRLSLEGMGLIAALEERERAATGIGSLKVRKNSVFGWFIEVTRAQVHRVPDRYLRKQTLSTGERYVTPELKELEEGVNGADLRRIELERRRFGELRERIAAASSRLLALAAALAALDVLANLAEISVRHRWVRPDVDDTLGLAIDGGRHPVVEATLEDDRFVPNDLRIEAGERGERRLVVLTGPNMAGKSTVLRQVALIVLLAQIGSHVPADRARVGLCDRIFTRVGAVDDLARGQSTFMVEMAETAAILHHATRRSLVILDEIGRGTSTYDGLAIAWAVADDLASRVRCRALFATHYHELCALADQRDGVVNQSIAVHESGDRIVFLRKLKEGGASRSYGIQCARLAGLPAPVIEHARHLLERFEKHAPRDDRSQLSLFGVVPTSDDGGRDARRHEEDARHEDGAPDRLRKALAELEPDTMSPRQALEALYALKGLS